MMVHTTYDLPNLKVRVVLVETTREQDNGRGLDVDYFYSEARVQELAH